MAARRMTKEDRTIRTFRGVVTESAANTFTETAIDTNLSVHGNVIAMIEGLQVLIPMATMLLLTANRDGLSWQLTKDTKAALVGMNDDDVVTADAISLYLATSGSSIMKGHQCYSIQPGPFPLLGNLYLGVQGESLASAASISCMVHYRLRTVSELEAVRTALS